MTKMHKLWYICISVKKTPHLILSSFTHCTVNVIYLAFDQNQQFVALSARNILRAFHKTFSYILYTTRTTLQVIKVQWQKCVIITCYLTYLNMYIFKVMSSSLVGEEYGYPLSSSTPTLRFFTSLNCTLWQKKIIELSEKHTVCFSKIEAGSDRWLCLKNETPGINRSTFLQLWPFQTAWRKSMKNMPYPFNSHITQKSNCYLLSSNKSIAWTRTAFYVFLSEIN